MYKVIFFINSTLNNPRQLNKNIHINTVVGKIESK